VKKLIAAAAVVAVLYVGLTQFTGTHDVPGVPAPATEAVANAFRDQQSGVLVEGEGVLVKVLPDDDDGSRHQRFILRLPSGQTLLIAHNIDIAPRVASPESGDLVRFKGVYEWNPQGGVVHWTHRDPNGMHEAGWLEHDGEIHR
jgi:hypothetical protein